MLTHIHVHGACKEVLIEGCQRVVVLLDGVSGKLVVSGSDQVRIAHAGTVCKEMLLRSSPRTIIHAVDEHANTDIETIASAGSGFIIAPADMVKPPAAPEVRALSADAAADAAAAAAAAAADADAAATAAAAAAAI